MPQYQVPFEAPREKLKRAEKHINDLSAICDEFFAEHYRLILIDYACPAPYVRKRGIRTKNKNPLPSCIPLILGDAIHNLRAALDLLAFQLLKDSGRSIDSIYFPIATKNTGPEAAKRTIESRGIKFAGCDVVKLFISFEPYKGGRLHLWELHDLDIIDKHRLLLTIAQFTQVSRLILKEIDPLAPNWNFTNSNIGDMSVDWFSTPLPGWAWFPSHLISDHEHDLGMTGTVFFKEGPFAGKPVLQTLNVLADNVRSVIESTEALFT
jgi:hypothetical protein